MQMLKSQHNIWIFLLCAVGAQAVFVYGVANEHWSADHYPMGRFYILLILAIIFMILDRGISGIWDLIRPMLVWRVSIWWYVFAVTWLTVFALAVLFAKNLISGNGIVTIPLTFTILNNFSLMKGIFLSSIIEEIVWIGLILTALQKRFTPLVASQILGVFWYLWWVPVILYGQAVVPGLPVSILWFHYLGIAATCAWVYYFTRSGLIVALMQMLTNAVSLIVPILPNLSDLPTYITFIIGKYLFAILLFSVFGPKPLFGKTAKAAYRA